MFFTEFLALIEAENYSAALKWLQERDLNDLKKEDFIVKQNIETQASHSVSDEKQQTNIFHVLTSLKSLDDALDSNSPQQATAKSILQAFLPESVSNSRLRITQPLIDAWLAVSPNGFTPFAQAVNANFFNITSVLLSGKLYDFYCNHSGETVIHKAVAALRFNLVKDIIWYTQQRALRHENKEGHIPLVACLQDYREQREIGKIAMLTQLLFADDDYLVVENQVALNRDLLKKELWKYAIDYCLEYNSEGSPHKIDFFLLDFIKRAAEKRGYNMDEVRTYINIKWILKPAIKKLFHEAITAQPQDMVQRTARLTMRNPNLMKTLGVEMRTLGAVGTARSWSRERQPLSQGMNVTSHGLFTTASAAVSKPTDKTANALADLNLSDSEDDQDDEKDNGSPKPK